MYGVPEYTFFFNPRVNKLGSDIGLYIRNDLDCVICQDLNRMTSFIECLFVEIRIYLDHKTL